MATFRDGKCQKKRFPLSNGRLDPDLREKPLVKLRTNNSVLHSPNDRFGKGDQQADGYTASALLIRANSVLLKMLLLLVALTLVFSRPNDD
ncbi:hypothetical protein Ancab_000069 [Ancistrocladus abbreviatus]